MYELDFSGKTVLVIGGSSGIGMSGAHEPRQRPIEIHPTLISKACTTPRSTLRTRR
jgi:short-subunit dehydrogenase involved in D-alanine esterification of teichoic acids